MAYSPSTIASPSGSRSDNAAYERGKRKACPGSAPDGREDDHPNAGTPTEPVRTPRQINCGSSRPGAGSLKIAERQGGAAECQQYHRDRTDSVEDTTRMPGQQVHVGISEDSQCPQTERLRVAEVCACVGMKQALPYPAFAL
jgi:hypothetical protein